MEKYDEIPVELTELDQWCCFSKEWIPERQKFTKRPVDPKTGSLAKSNDSSTWADFDTAVEQSEKYDGIGFFFNGEHFGVDLDNCESEILRYQNGDLEDNKVAEFIETLGSYSEISPSGKGIHIICKGSLPAGGRRKNDVEMYDHGRFFTMTGNRIGSYFGIFDDEGYGKINYLHHKYIGETSVPVADLSALAIEGNDLTTDEIIKDALASKHGDRFRMFLEGGWENKGQADWSAADMTFCNDLAFWCAKDIEKMDTIFRQSSLYREKWDSKRENETYGYQTMLKAISSCTDTYVPQKFELNISKEALKGSKKPRKAFSYDDMGNTSRFLYTFGENVLYSYNTKCWYYWANKYWAEDVKGKVHEMADFVADSIREEPIFVSDPNDEDLVEKAKKNLQKHVKYTRNFRGKENMLKDVQHHVAVMPAEFDANGMLFNVQNGYIDLANGHLMEHQKSKKFTKISNADFFEDAECPQWKEFLHETFKGDTDLIDYVQRAIGYSMSAETSEQVMFILLGNGRNGKSVLLNVLNEVFGTYAMNIQPQTIAVKSGGGANSDIARLQGARFVTTTEPNRGMKLDEGTVKQITGGDTVTARFLYGKEFEYKPEFKLWMATNYKPIINGTDDGIWRRMVVIPFENQIPEHKVDKKLTYKLTAELTGILKWCIDGYAMWREKGLDEPKIIKEQRKDYRGEMDLIQRFIDDACETRDTSAETFGKDLWTEFKEWVKEANEYDHFSSKRFHMEMEKHFTKKRKTAGMVYYGIELKKRSQFSENYFRIVK